MKSLLIVGAGFLGREVLSWAKHCEGYGTEWTIKGFLDGRAHLLRGFKYVEPILCPPEEYAPEPDDRFAVAVGKPHDKQKYSEMLRARGAKFWNLVHPSVVMGENVMLGTGVILCPHVTVSCDVTIGDLVTVNMHSYVAHDVTISSFAQVHGHVSINGRVSIGEGAEIGSGAVLLPDCAVGKYATVGAGSVVLRGVEDGATVFGNPAKPLGLPAAKN